MVFWLFLGSHWSDWAQSFSIESGISRHKFRVPTRGTLEHFEISIFLTLTPLEGTLGKIFLTQKLHFSYSIVIEHLIKHLQKIISTKRGEWHTLTHQGLSAYIRDYQYPSMTTSIHWGLPAPIRDYQHPSGSTSTYQGLPTSIRDYQHPSGTTSNHQGLPAYIRDYKHLSGTTGIH